MAGPCFLAKLVPASLVFFWGALGAQAATVTYDADTVPPGAQDGVGAGWNTANVNFWDGAADVPWPNTTADIAVFGAGSGAGGTVAVGTVTANGITFGNPGSGAYTLTGGTITLDGTTPTINFTPSATINSVISGSSGLTVSAASATPTLTLGGANTYTGVTTVTRGNLQITNSSALGATGAGNQTVITGNDGTSSTTLVLGTTAPLTVNESLVFNGNVAGRARLSSNSAQNHTLTGPIDVSSTGNLVQFASDSTGSIRVTGDITGTMTGGSLLFLRGTSTNASNSLAGSVNLSGGGLAKTDTGLWVVGAAGKTYNWNGTNVAVGTLRMGAANVLPATTAVSLGQNDTLSATLDLAGFDQTTTGITFNYGGTAVATTGQITTGAGTLTLNGNLTYNTVNSYTGAGSLISGNLNLGGGTRSFTVNDSTGAGTELTVSAVISSGSLIKASTGTNGLGTLSLTGANTFAGNVTVNGGDVRINNSSALGAGPKTVTIVPTTNPVSLPSLVLDGSGGPINLASNLSFTTSYDALASGVPIAGEGAVINQAGNNSIAGNFTLTSGGGGTTFLSNAGKLTLSGSMSVASGAALRAVFLRGAGDGEISGAIVNGLGTNSVSKDAGAGTWILSGANTYTGGTAVSAGTLQVGTGGVGSTAAGSAVAVNAGGTLAGTGTVSGATTLASGAILSPGDSGGAAIGTLRMSSLLAGSGSKMSLGLFSAVHTLTPAQLGDTPNYASYVSGIGYNTFGPNDTLDGGTNYDALELSGTFALSATSTIAITSVPATPVLGMIFDVLDASSYSGVNPDIDISALGASFPYSFNTSLFSTYGILVLVPEPSRALLLLAGAGLLIGRRRR